MADQPPSEKHKLPDLQELFHPLKETFGKHRADNKLSNIPPGIIEILNESRNLHAYMKAHQDFLDVLTDIVSSKSAKDVKTRLEEFLDERWQVQDKYDDFFIELSSPKIG